jgi:hypothetical protein
MHMGRWTPMVLVLTLLAGCGNKPAPQTEPVVFDVAYGVVVGAGDLAGYSVRYTDDSGNDVSETVPPGQPWAHRSKITSSPMLYVQLEVRLQPAAYPGGAYPKIQCRFDVNKVMIGGEESTRAICRVGAYGSEIETKLRDGAKGSPGSHPTALR